MDIDIVNQNLAAAALDRAGRKIKEKELKQACAGFEAIFLNTLLKSMRKSLPGDGLFSESNGMNIYKSMYDQHLAEELSNGRPSLGIKEFLYRQLKDSL